MLERLKYCRHLVAKIRSYSLRLMRKEKMTRVKVGAMKLWDIVQLGL